MLLSKNVACAISALSALGLSSARADVITFDASTWLTNVSPYAVSSNFGGIYATPTSTVTLANGATLAANDTLTVVQAYNGWGGFTAGAYGPSSGGTYTGDLLDTSGANLTNTNATSLTLSFAAGTSLGLYVQADDPLFGSTSHTITATLSDGVQNAITRSFTPALGDDQFIGFYGSNATSLTLTISNVPNGDFVVGNIAVSPVPLPAALPLFATAVGGLGLARTARKRRSR